MNIEALQVLFGILVIAVLCLKLYLNYRQKHAIVAHQQSVPTDFAATITLPEHQKAANYNLAKITLDNVETLIGSVMLLIFTLGGGIQHLNNQFINLTDSPLSQGVAVIAALSVINFIIGLPFAIYSTFSLEAHFGFNKTTAKVFILDNIKSILLAIIIGIPILYLVLWLMQIMGDNWWLWVFAVMVGFNLLILVIYPTVIAPLFNKFSPLTDVALKTRIEQLLTKCGFKTSGVFVMDGSKRSSHGNAYFTGIGKSKRIVFFDTLIKQLSTDEIEAILAHELGHFKKRHVVKQMIVMFGITFIALFVLSIFIKSPLFYNALGVTTVTNANALILFMLLLDVALFPLAPLSSYFSRKNEFEADHFAKQHTDQEHLISGLVKLYRDNASTLTPDPLYVKFYYSHPPATVRIAALKAQA